MCDVARRSDSFWTSVQVSKLKRAEARAPTPSSFEMPRVLKIGGIGFIFRRASGRNFSINHVLLFPTGGFGERHEYLCPRGGQRAAGGGL